MNNKEVDVAMQRWELAEAKLRKEDPKHELAQERAEMAIMGGHDYTMQDQPGKNSRTAKK